MGMTVICFHNNNEENAARCKDPRMQSYGCI